MTGTMQEKDFLILTKDFLKEINIDLDETPSTPLDSIDFTCKGFQCTVYPHPSEQLIIIEVGIMHLDPDDPNPDVEPFIILHKLNWATRLTNSVMTCISEDDLLLISKSYPLVEMNGSRLAAEMAFMLDMAVNLKDTWHNLHDHSDPEQDFKNHITPNPFDMA